LLYVFWCHIPKFRTLLSHETFYYKLSLFASKNVKCLKTLLANIRMLHQPYGICKSSILYFQPPYSLIAKMGFCFLVPSEIFVSHWNHLMHLQIKCSWTYCYLITAWQHPRSSHLSFTLSCPFFFFFFLIIPYFPLY